MRNTPSTMSRSNKNTSLGLFFCLEAPQFLVWYPRNNRSTTRCYWTETLYIVETLASHAYIGGVNAIKHTKPSLKTSISFSGTATIITCAHCLNCSIAFSLGRTSVATSGSGTVVLFRPPRYNSPPSRANHSGEKPSVSVAKMAWQASVSASVGLKCGFRTSREWPASGEMGMRDLEAGKRVVKTRGDQAPEAITRREHGTVFEIVS